MEVVRVYWWEHSTKIGQYSAVKVHASVKISLREGVLIPSLVENYEIIVQLLEGLEP